MFVYQILITTNAQKLSKENKELLKRVSELLSSYQPSSIASLGPESSMEREDKFDRGIERAMEFVNVIGQLDSFINDKARIFLKRLNAMYEIDD